MTFLADAGQGSQLGGMLLQAIGTYYGVRSQQLSLRSSAMSAEFDATMADLNARQAEAQANDVLRAGEDRAALLTMQRGQQEATERTQQGASGFTGGGSAAEVQASMALARRLDVHGIRLESIAQANAARTQGVNFRNRAAMSRVSARNLRATSGTMSAWGSTLTSLLGSGSTLSSQWAQTEARGT